MRPNTALIKWIITAVCIFFSFYTSAQNVNQDSLRAAQKQRSDSIKAVQKKRADSLEVIRKYKNSKIYKDSIENARQARVDSMKAARQLVTDSIKKERQRIMDSTIAVRKNYMDSIKKVNDSIKTVRMKELAILKAERQRRTDSMAAVRAYKESKTYKDSVALVKQARQDSILAERKKVNDSIKAARKATNDSIIAERKRVTDSIVTERKRVTDSIRASIDSIKTERMRVMDSLKVIRQARADSLAEIRAKRELANAEKEKEKEKKKKLALEIKFEEEKKEYSNEKLRKKGWSPPRRLMQNTFTRYNYYFNADLRMDEAIDNMVRSKQDNYDSLLALFPFDPDVDSAKLASDMDTIIRKSSLGIYIHDPRSKWQDDLYLLAGQAYYYKGDYENAALAFRYIISEAEKAEKEKQKKKNKKNKNKDKEIKPATFASPPKTGIAKIIGHNEAKNHAMLWLSRTLAQNHQTGLAQTLIDMLRNDANFPKKDLGRLAVEQAFIDLKKNDYTHAIISLSTVTNDKELPNWLRLRAAYLNGQLLQQDNNYDKSTESFRKALALHPSVDMSFNAQKHIAFNSVNGEGDPNEAQHILTKMSQDAKYKSFYDQIYYGLGLIAKKLEKPSTEVITLLRKSLENGSNNNKQKGLTYMTLGDEYYLQQNYTLAKQAYDSAGMLLDQQDREWQIANKRANVLDKISEPGSVVKITDSLIYLASLNVEEQKNYINKYIKDLEKWIADSTFQAQNAPTQQQMQSVNLNQNATSWYFNNPTLMKKGLNEFKQKWGDIKLKDNWRRSLAGFGDGGTGDNNNIEPEEPTSRIPHPDTLLAQIPKGDALDSIKHENNLALFELGKGYYYDLEDNNNAIKTFDTLQVRYPKHQNEAEELYIRYLIAIRNQYQNEADRCYNELQQNYGYSEWAKRIKDSKNNANNDDIWANKEQTLSEHYDETYDLLIQRNYNKAISRSDEAPTLFNNLGTYRNKYELVRITAVAGLGKFVQADSLLKAFVTKNPGDSLIDWANTVWEYVKKNKHTDSLANLQAKTNDSLNYNDSLNSQNNNQNFNDYVVDKSTKHYVLIIAALDAKFTALRSGLNDYNAMSDGNKNIVVTMTNMETGIGVIVCKEFDNAIKAKNYINEITLSKNLFRAYEDKRTFNIVSITEANFQKLFIKKDTKEYVTFWKKNYR